MRKLYISAAAAAALAAGCAQNSQTLPAALNAGASKSPVAAQARFAPDAPPRCPNQHQRKGYVQTSTSLKRRGGTLCVGEFHGFGGTLQYPSVDRSVELTNRVSIKNVYDEQGLGSGPVLLYLNLHFHSGTRFGASVVARGGLESKKFVPGQSYTAFGIVQVGHLVFMFTPCYTVATTSAYGGLLPNVGAIFDNAIVTGNGFGVVEIYSGTQASQECAGTSS